MIDGNCTWLPATSSLSLAFSSHDWIRTSSCWVCVSGCLGKCVPHVCVCRRRCDSVLMATCGSWYLSVSVCLLCVCVCVSNTGLGSTLPPIPSGNWRTCFSVAVKPTQVGAPSAGLGEVSFPPVKDRLYGMGVAVPPVPLWEGQRGSSKVPWLRPPQAVVWVSLRNRSQMLPASML